MKGIIASILIIIGLSVIAVSFIMPFNTYDIFALKSNPCPKYCDGCCVSTKPRNATGLVANGPTSYNQKALMRNNSPTPPACPETGPEPIPSNCTKKPKF